MKVPLVVFCVVVLIGVLSLGLVFFSLIKVLFVASNLDVKILFYLSLFQLQKHNFLV